MHKRRSAARASRLSEPGVVPPVGLRRIPPLHLGGWLSGVAAPYCTGPGAFESLLCVLSCPASACHDSEAPAARQGVKSVAA
jgi:hypothetical protein